jgi:hypothetical protein
VTISKSNLEALIVNLVGVPTNANLCNYPENPQKPPKPSKTLKYPKIWGIAIFPEKTQGFSREDMNPSKKHAVCYSST